MILCTDRLVFVSRVIAGGVSFFSVIVLCL